MSTRARTVSYFLSIIAIAAIFFSIEFVTEKYFYPDDEVVDILAAVIGALSFAPCKRLFDRATDRVFARAPRDARAEFFANIAHELQTPIAILRGNVEVLQRPSATDVERRCAERVIVFTLDGMSRLIAGVLEGAKLRFGATAGRQPHDVSITDLLQEVYESCVILAEDNGIKLALVEPGPANGADTDGGGGIEGMLVRGDRDRLREVLFNLISNAFKHTPRGGMVTLRASRTKGKICIAVEDSGSGIPPEDVLHLFERFYRIERGPGAAPGTGLGLNICHEIVKAHGGDIRVESEVGKGSRFIVSLPLAPPARRPPLPSVSAIINL